MDSTPIATIICPGCSAELDAAAEACPECGASTSTPQPRSASEGGPPPRLIERPWMMTIVVLHLGLFGIPMYWRTGYSRNTRVALVCVSILYTFFVAVVVVWGLSQVVKAFQLLR